MQWDRRAVVYGSTDVVCDQDHQFLNNSVGQNPCLIYAYTVGSCASVFVQVQSLNQSTTYPPPSGNPNLGIQSASECTCGRVPYNLISACSTCQGKSVLSWAAYEGSCDGFDGKYNFSSHVPAGSALPVWATRQAHATKFVWDTALNDKGYGEFLPSGSSGNASVTQTGVSGPSQVPQSPFEHGSTVDNSAAVGLATTAVILALFIAGAFVYFWRRMTTARTQTDKSSATGSQASTIAHSVLFNILIILSIVNACITTWVSVALKISGVLGLDSLRRFLYFLVFTSWWTLVGSVYFLLAFLYDRSIRDENGTFTSTRFGSLNAHLVWLLVTCPLWLLGASLSAAGVAHNCPVHCSQLRAVPVFAFLELMAMCLILVVAVYSYWNIRRRSKPVKRLGRSPSQSAGKKLRGR